LSDGLRVANANCPQILCPQNVILYNNRSLRCLHVFYLFLLSTVQVSVSSKLFDANGGLTSLSLSLSQYCANAMYDCWRSDKLRRSLNNCHAVCTQRTIAPHDTSPWWTYIIMRTCIYTGDRSLYSITTWERPSKTTPVVVIAALNSTQV